MDRKRLRELAKTIVRRLGLYPLAARAADRLRRAKRALRHRIAAMDASPATYDLLPLPDDGWPHDYDVICLPVILWNSRFQRPQQLMQQMADRAHRVFYASGGFHSGGEAETTAIRPNVFETTLPGRPGTNVYQELPTDAEVEQMAVGIEALRKRYRIAAAVVVVELPFWTALAERLRERFGWPIVYDCMDDHSGFSTNCATMLAAEDRTVAEADLVVVTAQLLHDKVAGKARRAEIIRNACDYEHFANCPNAAMPSPAPTTVGFYGAIAEWFDVEMAADLAESRPDWRFELIGSTFTADISRLERLPNVRFLGEKPYAELPRLIAGWDCFIIPFKRIPLTEATNPVKAYEMLATGKPVVAVNLPELRPMAAEGLLALADTAPEFAAAIERVIAADSEIERARRRAFAARNTWSQRCDAFDAAARSLFPPASIIVVTYNNLHLNQMCLQSIFRRTAYPNYEVIVVDNASTDGTAEWLAGEGAHEPRLRVIANGDNRGFSAANNQGLRAARGEFVCLLNNDTVVTQGWLATLIGHFHNSPKLGMVGPTTNMAGNEAKVPVGYSDIADLHRWANGYCRLHESETLPMKMLGFFCVVLRREVYERVGELDESFGVGYFEDTDYCYRAHRAGYELRCARDAFVHHWQGASFRLLGDDSFADIYRKNQVLFESKWGADSMAGAY
jgi:GT2 family glycosyltransferase